MKDLIRTTVLLAGVVATTAIAQSPKPASDDRALVGDWRGDSICVVRPSACNDEKALYHFKQIGGQPNRFSLQADKIVNGQAEEMGTMECSYAPEKHAVTCSTPRLALYLTLKGNSLDGTMNLTDGTLWRNISLKKDGA
jgi:hypothetical protein